MNVEQYLPYWEKAKPAMLAKFLSLRPLLIQLIEFDVTEPFFNEGGDECSVCMNIVASEGTTIVGIDFTLTDADVSGGDGGVGVNFSLTGYNALVLGGFSPCNYTNNVFTTDIAEMLERIEMLDVMQAAVYIKHEALTNETLLHECGAAGVI